MNPFSGQTSGRRGVCKQSFSSSKSRFPPPNSASTKPSSFPPHKPLQATFARPFFFFASTSPVPPISIPIQPLSTSAISYLIFPTSNASWIPQTVPTCRHHGKLPGTSHANSGLYTGRGSCHRQHQSFGAIPLPAPLPSARLNPAALTGSRG